MRNEPTAATVMQPADDICVSSLREAFILLCDHMDVDSAPFRRRLTEYVTTPANKVFGSWYEADHFVARLLDAGEIALA